MFTGANSWPFGPNSFNGYPPNLPNPFPLKDTGCRAFNLPNIPPQRDLFNRFTEATPPAGWALTNISCNYSKSVVHSFGNTVTVDQADPNVKCTFTNTCASSPQDLSTGAVPWLVTRPSSTTAMAFPTAPFGSWVVPPVGTSWIQPSPVFGNNEPSGVYTYRVRFQMPCPGKLWGWFAADNQASFQLDSNPPSPICLGTPLYYCFTAANVTNFSKPVSAGVHVITIRVNNKPGGSSPTGLVAHITAQ
jgi:hypothetical protein